MACSQLVILKGLLPKSGPIQNITTEQLAESDPYRSRSILALVQAVYGMRTCALRRVGLH